MKLNLSLKKKYIKTLSHKAKTFPVLQTPFVVGGTDIPESEIEKCEKTK